MLYTSAFSYEPCKHQTRVLVVKESCVTESLVSDAFADESFQVTSVSNSISALPLLVDKAATDEPFDLIVCAFLPDDLQQIAFFKVASHQPSMPAIILIGAHSVDAVLAALRLGAADYMFESVTPAELLASATAVLARRETLHRLSLVEGIIDGLSRLTVYHEKYADRSMNTKHTVNGHIKVGELTIDTERHTIEWCGQPCSVTPIEYALLRYLAETPNRARSYCEIVRWTHGHSINDAEAKLLLKSHARNLRRKLGSNALVNLKGVGYVLKVSSDHHHYASNLAFLEGEAALS